MKKNLFITLGVIVLLLALLAWGYLFLFGNPSSSDDFFTDLGFAITPQPTAPTATEEYERPQTLVDVEGIPLRQLTLRPVAGFIGLVREGDRMVRYVEKGTGHIYDINLATGEEARIINTTNARVTSAWFGTTGKYIALQTENGYRRTTLVGTLNNEREDSTLTTSTLPPQATNVTFTGTSTLTYTLTSETETTGYRYDIATAQQSEIFIVPFLSIKTLNVDNTTYLYNRYAPELLGGLFEANGLLYTSVLPQEFGFVAQMSPDWIVYSYAKDGELKNVAKNKTTDTITTIPLLLIPEKCVFSKLVVNSLWCAGPLTETSPQYLKNWYQGTFRANDAFWRISLGGGSATLVVNPPTEVGREIDVTSLATLADETSLLFINKNDNTLWQYDFLAE